DPWRWLGSRARWTSSWRARAAAHGAVRAASWPWSTWTWRRSPNPWAAGRGRWRAGTTYLVIPPTLPLRADAAVGPARRCGEVEWGHATDGIDHGRGHPPARARPRGAARPALGGGARQRPAGGDGPFPRRR